MFNLHKNNYFNNDFDYQKIESIVDETAYIHRDINYDDNVIQCIVTGTNGAFVFLPADKDDRNIKDKILNIYSTIGLSKDNCFIFLYNDDISYFFDNGDFLEIDDIYDTFNNLFYNLYRPWHEINNYNTVGLLKEITAMNEKNFDNMTYNYNGNTYQMHCDDDNDITDEDGDEYIKDVICMDNVTKIKDKLDTLQNSKTVSKNIKVVDGITYVGHNKPLQIGKGKYTIDTGLASSDIEWSPVSEDDTNKIALMMIFGGWFGLHKYYHGNIVSGLLYTCTAGCLGMLPLFDLINLYLGNYYYTYVDYGDTRDKQKIYLQRPSNKLLLLIGIVAIPILSILSWTIIYKNLVGLISAPLSQTVRNNISNELQNNGSSNTLDILSNIIGH